MDSRENPKFGRKVFFLNPPVSFQKTLIEVLKELEYEVYIIKSYQDAKNVLRDYENAICFINIDDELSIKQWYNFIKTFKLDPTLKSIFLGVISFRTSLAVKTRFVMDLALPGGFIDIKKVDAELVEKIIAILDLNGAKGIRKYIRLECENLDNVSGYLARQDKLYPIKIDNISSVGLACKFSLECVQIFEKNTLVDNLSITLGRSTYVCSAVVYNTVISENSGLAVLMFTNETPKATKNGIRSFIFQILEEKETKLLKGLPRDEDSYNSIQKYIDQAKASGVDEDSLQKEKNDSDSFSENDMESPADLEEI